MQLIDFINNFLWSYVLIFTLLACALWFTLKTRFVQFRMIGEMVRLLVDTSDVKRGHSASFQAFTISLASRVGTGNLAGVATAIAVGGPGAVFWMWIIALISSASAFVESTLAQLYKVRSEQSFIGGPAYYMKLGLRKPWMGVLFAVLIIATFGLAFNSVQSNTLCAAFEMAFGWNHTYTGLAVTLLSAVVFFGGVKRIARVSSVIVPFMAIGYILVALVILLINITELPALIAWIVESALGWEQVAGGGVGAAVMQGIKRGRVSNEPGMGSAPNAAATAHTSHPVKQGLIQALGVFTDTLLICSCTAFIILCSGVPLDGSLNGIQLTQEALRQEIGPAGGIFVAIALFFFAFSTILGNYYYGESNILYLTGRRWVLNLYRLAAAGMVCFGAIATLEMVWGLADITMALMTLCNLVAIVLLGKYAFRLLQDYRQQKRQGTKNPQFTASRLSEQIPGVSCW